MSPRVPPAPEEWDIREDEGEGEDTPRDSMHAPLRLDRGGDLFIPVNVRVYFFVELTKLPTCRRVKMFPTLSKFLSEPPFELPL